MPTPSEYSQFRRLVGKDGDTASLSDAKITGYLDDATSELTAYFQPAPVTAFDTLVTQYHPEVIYKAAINWWWNYAASLAEKVTMQMGQGVSNEGEKWNRAMTTIEKLQAHYKQIEQLGINITSGNFSRFSKLTLTRLGGQREEDGLV